ncbi:LacI family DNA-binding transcriptional regulator [Listeria costaricensis]|uniref:LacI family DNA-binding transcriptional regulator n=1 Tax=Listeria costaricensis TaxID=2026604 RepID=UPI000C082FB6|nr:LacI family DNA-binding transcriptional regulator [Listeria costaricensis]
MTKSIRDVARKANVSVSTVSRVLNNSKPVSKELRERVLAAIEEEEFVPNMLARGLVNKTTKLIGVIIPRISNTFFSSLIEGIEKVSRASGYSLMFISSGGDLDREIESLRLFRERQVDGVIFSLTEFNDKLAQFYEKNTYPTVFVGQEVEQTPYPYITIDNFQASYEVTRYFIQQGHTKIGMIHGPEHDMATGKDRYLGYKRAMENAGLEVRQEWLAGDFHSIQNGYRCAQKIMAATEKVTGIVAASDLMAVGAIDFLTEKNQYNVPDDISISGFDDSEIAHVIRPQLTTVKQDPVLIGEEAMRLLKQQIETGEITQKATYMPYHLVERSSISRRIP